MRARETPRTEEWRAYINGHGKLVECEADGPDQFVVIPKPTEVPKCEKAPVDAERERMLDLLEHAFNALGERLGTGTTGASMDEIEVLLREHGRLTDSPSAPVSLERGE